MKNKIWWIALVAVVVIVILVATQPKKSEINTIGVIAPLSGPAASAGQSIQRSIDLASTSVAKIIYEDDECDTKKALSAYQNLKLKGVKVFYIGCSGSVLAVAPVAAQNGDVILTAYAGSAEIRKTGTEVIRFIPDALSIVDSINSYIKAHPNDTYAVLYENMDYPKSVVDNIDSIAKIALKEGYSGDEKSFLTHITKIKSSGATKIIFVPVSDVAAKIILKEMQNLKITTPIIGDVNLCDYSFSPKDYGMHGVCWKAELTTEGFSQFEKLFEATYSAKPLYPFYDAVTYDTAILLDSLFAKNLSVEEIKAEILDGIEGKIANYTFEPNGEVIGSKYLVEMVF